MTYEEIVAAAKEGFGKKDVSKFDGHLAVEFDVIGEGEGAFYVEIKDKNVYVEPYEYYDRDVRFIASAKTFLGLADGTVNAVAAFTTGQLKIDGSIDKALEFQKIFCD